MATAVRTRLVGRLECPGGGQVWVEGRTLYVGHMEAPAGTTMADVSDPRHPRILSQLAMPAGWHSHKVRVAGGLMLVNHEQIGRDNPDFGGGLGIYDVENPARPLLLTKWRTSAGSGIHRFSFDGRYAYISPTVEGYAGNIVMILDLTDPAHPQEVGRWWAPGQWVAGGEHYPVSSGALELKCHHPLRLGDRLYVSYWLGGRYILDIGEMSKPKLIAHHDTSLAFPHPTHTCLPMPQPLKGRRVMVVADEDVGPRWPSPPSFAWLYDISNETTPIPIATFQVEGLDRDGSPQATRTGCHQPSERLAGGTVIPFAWFAQGMRLVDIADPFAPREVGYYQPDPQPGSGRACSNDVTLDQRGLIYLADRMGGVDILETEML